MTDGMTDRLDQMLSMQRELQQKINGYDIGYQTYATRVSNIMLNVLGATDELHELLNETGWKPWAKSSFINTEAAQRELVDAWHFLMNLMLHLGMTGDDLYRMYREKNAVNHRRQDEGYDGVSGKCANCHRDLAEVALREVHAQSSPRIDFHCVCGAYVKSINA
jgi:dimeric dUTPase (all-alpha-NTP-PPase superfamily)